MFWQVAVNEDSTGTTGYWSAIESSAVSDSATSFSIVVFANYKKGIEVNGTRKWKLCCKSFTVCLTGLVYMNRSYF